MVVGIHVGERSEENPCHGGVTVPTKYLMLIHSERLCCPRSSTCSAHRRVGRFQRFRFSVCGSRQFPDLSCLLELRGNVDELSRTVASRGSLLFHGVPWEVTGVVEEAMAETDHRGARGVHRCCSTSAGACDAVSWEVQEDQRLRL